jgi:hypothetical protein
MGAMKRRIFGRKAGAHEPMALLLESSGVSTGGQKVDAGVVDQFALANTRRQVQVLRDQNIEGYVLFENDPTRYEFSPEADFVYPTRIH